MTVLVLAKATNLYYELRLKRRQLSMDLNEILAPGIYGPEGLPGVTILHSIEEAMESIQKIAQEIDDLRQKIQDAPYEKRYKAEIETLSRIAVKNGVNF